VKPRQPTVTVILTSYNHAKFIREAIESVLNQTFTDFELIIWDDASTDDSWEIICSYKDERIRAFRNEVNQRKVVNTVLQSGEVQGKFIAIHHSDDVWELEKLEKQVAFLENHAEVGAVFSTASIIDERGEPLRDTENFYYSIFDQPNRMRFEWLRCFATKANVLCHPSMLIRRLCYDTLGIYHHSMLQVPDFDMWVRLVMRYEIHIIQEKLVRFRILDNERNTSGNRPEVQIRGQFELYKVFQHFGKITSYEDLCRIFPEARTWANHGQEDVPFILGRVLIDLTPFPGGRLFAMELMLDALNDPVRSRNIFLDYPFTLNDFKEITGKHDVFSIVKSTDLQRRLQQVSSGNVIQSGIYLFDAADNLVFHDAVEVVLSPGKPNRIHFELPENLAFHRFAWDPIEHFPCVVETHKVTLEDEHGNIALPEAAPERSNGEEMDGKIWFYTFDGRQYYSVEGKWRHITIVATIEKINPFLVEERNIKLYRIIENQLLQEREAAAKFRKRLAEIVTTNFQPENTIIAGDTGNSITERKLLLAIIQQKIDENLSDLESLQIENQEKEDIIGVIEKDLISKRGELAKRNAEIEELMNDLQKKKIEIYQYARNIRAIEQSWSWKITSPLRKVNALWRGLRDLEK
jgi:glycosyltransferase involved in cell wall biosynthesis